MSFQSSTILLLGMLCSSALDGLEVSLDEKLSTAVLQSARARLSASVRGVYERRREKIPEVGS